MPALQAAWKLPVPLQAALPQDSPFTFSIPAPAQSVKALESKPCIPMIDLSLTVQHLVFRVSADFQLNCLPKTIPIILLTKTKCH